MERRLYFAYGSNMDQDQMKKRCPDSKFLEVVYLEDYEFVYDDYSITRNGAVANIVPKEGSIVWGVLYSISKSDEQNLDRYEGYPTVYQKKEVIVKNEQGNSYKAFAYLREPQKIDKPSEDYKNQIVNSAKKLNLPTEYINKYLIRDNNGT